MKLGHVDGKNRVYDSEGELLLLQDEGLLSRHGNVIMNVTKAWRSWCVAGVLAMEAGPFRCFLTDQRVVFIRRPDPRKAGAYLMTPYGAPEGIAKTYKARRILEAGGFEYYELCIEDIRFYKAYRNCVDLFVAGGKEKHMATIWNRGPRPELRAPLLSLLIKNRVPQR